MFLSRPASWWQTLSRQEKRYVRINLGVVLVHLVATAIFTVMAYRAGDVPFAGFVCLLCLGVTAEANKLMGVLFWGLRP